MTSLYKKAFGWRKGWAGFELARLGGEIVELLGARCLLRSVLVTGDVTAADFDGALNGGNGVVRVRVRGAVTVNGETELTVAD